MVDDIRAEIDEANKIARKVILSAMANTFENEAKAAGTLCSQVSVIALVIIIFWLLYGQFHSATQSGIILLNMPLPIIGGVFSAET